MKKRIIIGVILVLTIILLAPTISAFKPYEKKNNMIDESVKNYFSKFLKKQILDEPPSWYVTLRLLLLLSLLIRISILTPLAITPSDEYWGAYEIKSYFFAFILFTLVYRFAFWYILFDKIAEKNNWDIPYQI